MSARKDRVVSHMRTTHTGFSHRGHLPYTLSYFIIRKSVMFVFYCAVEDKSASFSPCLCSYAERESLNRDKSNKVPGLLSLMAC